MWKISLDTGYPFPAGAADLPKSPMQRPFPLTLWRIDEDTNDGYPYFLLEPEAAPPIVAPVAQHDYIRIFDMDTPKEEFDSNGIAILEPTRCEVVENLNGVFSLSMTHAIDLNGKWQYIKERNIIKALGQLFTIVQVQWNYSSENTGIVTVYAEHIFYQLNDPWIFPIPETMYYSSYSCDTIMKIGMANMYYHAEDGQHSYAFEGTSHIMWENKYIVPSNQGMTFVELLIGSGGITSVMGGELYRDNFYFSIENTMENSKENAFDIRIGLNLLGINRTVDVSTFCSYFRAYDNFGAWWAVAWEPNQFLLDNFPHHVIRSASFHYDEYDFDRLAQDGMEKFRDNCMPIISYEIDLEDVTKNPDYEQLQDLFEFKVGNSGRLFDVRLGGAIFLKITSTVTDAITGRIKSVGIGTTRSFTRSSTYPIITGVEPVPLAALLLVRDADGVFLYDADDIQIIEEVKY